MLTIPRKRIKSFTYDQTQFFVKNRMKQCCCFSAVQHMGSGPELISAVEHCGGEPDHHWRHDQLPFHSRGQRRHH